MSTTIIKDRLLEIVRDAASEAVQKAIVTIDGTTYDFPIHRTVVKDMKVLKYVRIQTQIGNITHAVIVDKYGVALAEQTFNVKKGTDGFMIAFEFTVTLGVA